ncbi:MAG TPA: WG repeat-containing protein, partial [Saprospiraceae bacterium]|nr:WG repeat-containing protein [Saprospiraceae bacterium]
MTAALRCFLLALFALASIHDTRSQTLVYPVRSGHKWGYINLRGKWMIRPRYEAFSETDLPWNIHPESNKLAPSPYRLVESDGKVGLTDRTLREVLPCQYKRIRPISRHWFAVEADSLFALANSKGEVLSQERFDDICGVDTLTQRRNERFFVKKNGRWGVYQVGVGIVIPIQHEDIASAYSPQYYRVKVPGKPLWSLINAQNQPVLPGEYMDIKAISKDFIALLPEGQNWIAVDERGTALFDPKWVRLEVLNRHHVWVQDIEQRSALWNVRGRKWVAGSDGSQEPSAYFPMDERFVAPYLFGAKGLIDSNGVLLVAPRFYDSITLSGLPDYYRVRNLSRNWGLLRVGMSTPVLSCRFTSLERFADSLTVACGGLGCGVYNGRLQELIAPAFERIEREGDTLNVYGTGDQLLRYRIERGGQVSLLEAFEDVMQIRIGTDKNFVEARPLRFGSSRSSSRRWLRGQYLNMSRDSSLLWKNDFGDWKLLRRRDGDYVERLYAQFPFCHMETLTPQDLCAVYRQDLAAKGRLAQAYAADTKALSRFALFRFSTGKFVTGPDFQGLRAEDLREGYPYAPFIDTLGRMGLIDAAGQVLTRPDGSPLRFTYIGDFVHGLARVCVGGVLRQIKMDEELPAVEPYHTFPQRFGLLDPNSKAKEYPGGRPLVVAPTEKSRPRWGFIDTLGRVVIEPRYDFAEAFNADTMAVVRRGDSLGLVNAAGQEVIPCRYLRVMAEGDGFYKMAIRNPYLFYYSQQGHQYCPPRYDRYLGFAEGLCLVRRDSAWGYMDSTGRERIGCRFALARHFSEGRAAVVEGGEWVFID